jgi:multiple sugar transport system permease protein
MNTPSHASSVVANERGSRARVANWLDRQAPFVFVLPTVLLILAFSIFPLVASAYLSLTRFELGEGGYQLTFTGLRNYVRLFSGSQQYHFTGVFRAPGIVSIATIVVAVLAVIYWFYRYLASDGGSQRTRSAAVARSAA